MSFISFVTRKQEKKWKIRRSETKAAKQRQAGSEDPAFSKLLHWKLPQFSRSLRRKEKRSDQKDRFASGRQTCREPEDRHFRHFILLEKAETIQWIRCLHGNFKYFPRSRGVPSRRRDCQAGESSAWYGNSLRMPGSSPCADLCGDHLPAGKDPSLAETHRPLRHIGRFADRRKSKLVRH